MKKLHIGFFVLLFLFVACSTPEEHQTFTHSPVSETGFPPEVFTTSPESDMDGYAAAQIASLESLELIDDYPLYRMQYYASYETAGSVLHDDQIMVDGGQESPAGWACSLFAAFIDPQSKLYGRNFDWEYSPAVLLFTDPPEGYASVSMVDIAYLGFEGSRASQLLELPLAERDRLLDAPYLPFDGMNEYGLAVGMAAVPAGQQPDRPKFETIDSLMVIRLMLDHARNVDEALEIFSQYNLDWGSGPALHYLIADRTGRSILLEFWGGEIKVIENRGAWQAATNFLQSANPDDLAGRCHRYDIIASSLGNLEGGFTQDQALNLLAEVSQENTQWSIVYDLSDGEIRIVMGHRYDWTVFATLDLIKAD